MLLLELDGWPTVDAGFLLDDRRDLTRILVAQDIRLQRVRHDDWDRVACPDHFRFRRTHRHGLLRTLLLSLSTVIPLRVSRVGARGPRQVVFLGTIGRRYGLTQAGLQRVSLGGLIGSA